MEFSLHAIKAILSIQTIMPLTFHILPNAHLDPVWLWDASEGFCQAVRTMRSVLDLMEEFPFLTFLRGETALYRHLEATDPETFGRVLARIREGRWEVVGGTEVQSDTNLPSAETLVRQYTEGLGYARMRLGVRPRVAWAADSFGHCAGLPDVLAAAGMDSFAFTRPFPATLPIRKPAFWWLGPSGARILCYRPEVGWYGTRRDEVPRRLDATLEDAARRDLDNVPVFLGIGDHGGGPSRRQILDVGAWAAAHPEVRVVWSGLHRFFDALRAEIATKGDDAFLPVVEGELGYTLRGCYASCLRIKSAFRRAEAELASAERTAAVVGAAPAAPVSPAPDDLRPVWRGLLFNAFHDILPGSCIERAADEQGQQLADVRHAARASVRDSLAALARAADTSVPPPSGSDLPAPLPFLVWNPHPWTYEGPVELEGCMDDSPDYFAPHGKGQAPLELRDPRGRRAPFQIVHAESEVADVVWRSRVVAEVRVPPLGFATYSLGWIPGAKAPAFRGPSVASPRPGAIAGERFAISAHPGAEGIRILRDGHPWLRGPGLQALLFQDAKGSWGDDAPRQYDESAAPVAWRVERVDVLERGPMRAVLFVRLAGERSWLELTLRLTAGRDVIDAEARLLWNERAARLKLSFPIGATATDCDTPAAIVRRPASVGEVPGGRWISALGRDGTPVLGFASDALYSFDVSEGGALRPSVVRASWFASSGAPEASHLPWRPATDVGEHRFRFLLAPGDAPLARLADELAEPPLVRIAQDSAPGPLGRTASLASLAPASLRLLALKPADDGSGALVLRVRETSGRAVPAASFSIGGRRIPLGRVPSRAIASWRLEGASAIPVLADEFPQKTQPNSKQQP